ncbi:MAG: glycosyltransferase [Nanoarchaeota archaeon]
MEKDLKVLMISSDRKLFIEGSVVSERMKEYGALVGELYIVVLSDAVHLLKDKQLSSNIWVYSTNSIVNFLRPFDAARLGKKIVFEKKFIRGKSIITTQDPFECGLSGLKVKKKWRIPLEVQLHTDPFSPYFDGFLNRIRKIIARKVLRNADGIRVVNEGLKSKISKFTSAPIKVLPIYIDIKRIEDAKVSFDLHARFKWHFILLTVSRLSPEKNLGLTLKVLAGVCNSFPDTGLVVVGSGPEEGRLKALARKLSIEKKVAFVGWQDSLTSYYKTANIFIQTSFFEGYGLALVEAGLSGLPVVTTPVGIAQELENEKDAYIIPLDRPEKFSEAVIDLIENNYKRENMSMNFKQTLESKLLTKEVYLARLKTNWEETSEAIDRIIEA